MFIRIIRNGEEEFISTFSGNFELRFSEDDQCLDIVLDEKAKPMSAHLIGRVYGTGKPGDDAFNHLGKKIGTFAAGREVAVTEKIDPAEVEKIVNESRRP